MRIGAHVSTAEVLHKCVERICDIGGEAMQIFACAPQAWRPVSHSADAIAALKQRSQECGITPIFLHGIYLVNLASDSESHVERSVQSLIESLRFCEASGARGTIFHVGSHKGAGFEAVLPAMIRAIQRVLDASSGDSWLILENSAGAGNTVASRFNELGTLVRESGSPRVKVCLDTCHAFASGYDLSSEAGVARTMEEFAREVGVDRLVAVHANDSKGALGAGKDRHENIGNGQIGMDGFRALMRHPAFQDVPFLLEVPGLDGKGPDRPNIELLRQIRDEVADPI